MAAPSSMTMDDCAKIIADNDIHTVICSFTDTWGISRGKYLPSEQFLSSGSFSMASVALSWTPRNEALPTPWAEIDSEFADMKVVPDLDSFRVAGWTTGTAIVLCDLFTEHGDPLPMCNRGMVKRSLAELAELGYTLHQAPELEFHLFTPDFKPITDRSYCYSIDRGDELDYVIGDIRESMRRTGIQCEASNTEYGESQIEINIRYSEGMRPLDDTIYFRQIVRSVAKKHGMRASFMVKPINGGSGSGMHVHQSLTDAQGNSVFASSDVKATKEQPLESSVMRKYLSGLLENQLDLQILAMPTITSYKRTEDYSFAPTQVCWGLDHRLVGVRCLVGIGPGSRLEIRWAAADANPYLLVHGYLQAGLDGLRNNYDLMPASYGDPHTDTSLTRVPKTITEAIDRFEKSAFARKAFGDMFVDTYTVMQRNELAAFNSHITDWELNRYLDVF